MLLYGKNKIYSCGAESRTVTAFDGCRGFVFRVLIQQPEVIRFGR